MTCARNRAVILSSSSSERNSALKLLRRQKKSAKECKNLNYSVGEMRLAGFTAIECKEAGFDTQKFLKRVKKGEIEEFEFYDFREIRNLGLEAEELLSRKIIETPREFCRIGLSDEKILKLKIESNVLKAFRMKIEGVSVSECMKAKLSAQNCRDAGYPASLIYPLCKSVSDFKIGDQVVCWNQKSKTEVPGSVNIFKKSHFFGVVIEALVKKDGTILAHRVKSDLLGKKSWRDEHYLRDQTPRGHLNNGFGPDRLLEWDK